MSRAKKPKSKARSGAPAGFKPIAKPGGKKYQHQIAAGFRKRLGDAKFALEAMERMDSRVRVHEYKDGSVDGEWVVTVPRGMSAGDITFAMEESFGRRGVQDQAWISYGARYIIKEDDEVYRRNKGMNQIGTKYHRARSWQKVVKVFPTLRGIMQTMAKKQRGRKATQVYLRLSWNPKDIKPKR